MVELFAGEVVTAPVVVVGLAVVVDMLTLDAVATSVLSLISVVVTLENVVVVGIVVKTPGVVAL